MMDHDGSYCLHTQRSQHSQKHSKALKSSSKTTPKELKKQLKNTLKTLSKHSRKTFTQGAGEGGQCQRQHGAFR